jgi:HK97 family phage major capsid protein
MRQITEAPTGDGGDLSTEQATKFDGLKMELQAIEKKVERQQFIDNAERRMNGEHIAGTGDGRLDAELRSFSLRKAILSQIPGHSEDTSRERELSNEIARRAGRPFQGIAVPMAALYQPVEKRVVTSDVNTSTAGGGALIATTLGPVIDLLRETLVVRRLGATILTGLVGNVDLPKLTTGASTGWVAENSALTPSDQDYDSVQLRPKHVGGIVEFSRNMLLQSTPDIESLIRSDFAAKIAREIDRVAINGGGANEPTGIIATTAVDNSTDFSTPSWTAVLELIAAVEATNATGTAFAATPLVVQVLRSTAKVGSSDSVMVMQEPDSLAGYPLAQSNIVPAAHIVFGNWADLVLAFWSELDVLVNPYGKPAFDKGNVEVRAMATADCALRHAESFAYAEVGGSTA